MFSGLSLRSLEFFVKYTRAILLPLSITPLKASYANA